MREYVAKVAQSTGDRLFAKRVGAKTNPEEWIGLDVAKVPFTGGHVAVISATDKGDMLSPTYKAPKHERVVGRRLVISRGDAEEKAMGRGHDIERAITQVTGRRVFNIPLPAGTWPTPLPPEELNLED